MNFTGDVSYTESWDENTTILHFFGGGAFRLRMTGVNDLVDDGDQTYPVYLDPVTVAAYNNESR